MEDLYQVLGVPRGATQADIKKAYRQLVRKYHPDTHPGDKNAEETFKKINAAYSVLGDEEKRARYDQFGTTDENAGGNPFGGGFGGAGGFGDIFGDLFEQVFTGGMGGMGGRGSRADPNAPRRGADLEMHLTVSLVEAAKGITRSVQVPRSESCKACGGTGAKAGTAPETCDRCKGSGQVQSVQRTPFGQFMSVTTCPKCQGLGKIIKEACPECNGAGTVRRSHKLDIKIPAGVDTGTRLRLTKEGEAGKNGGSAGDLFLVIEVESDKNFERDGGDLHSKLLLTYPQAVLGTTVPVKTLIDGEEKLDIPAGTGYGRVLKIKGKGMPRLRGPRGRGDLYVHVYIDIPTKLTEKQKTLVEELAKEMKVPVDGGDSGIFDKFKKLFD